MQNLTYTSENAELKREETKAMLDENFELGSKLLQALNENSFSEEKENLQANFKKLYENLKTLEPRLTKRIYDSEEYDANLRNLEYMLFLFSDTENERKYLQENRYRITQAVDYFINMKSKNARLKEEDIGVKIGGLRNSFKKSVASILGGIITKFPIAKTISYPRGIEQDKVDETNIVSYNEELENRAFFIGGINTVIEGRTEITDESHTQYGTGFFGGFFPQAKEQLAKNSFLNEKFQKGMTPKEYDGKDKINADGEGTNFAGIADMLAERGLGMDFLNQFYMGDRKKVEAAIRKAQEFLESPEGQKTEVIVTHSYGGVIAKALDLSKTNVKKVVTISAPLGDHFVKEGLVPREKYANSIANRNVEWITVGSEKDTVVAENVSSYANEKHMGDSDLEHYKGTYVGKLDVEKLDNVFNFAGVGNK